MVQVNYAAVKRHYKLSSLVYTIIKEFYNLQYTFSVVSVDTGFLITYLLSKVRRSLISL